MTFASPIRTRALCFTAALAGFAASAQLAPAHDWHSYNGHQYALTEQRGSWLASEAEAVSAGGHLVTVNDDAENNFLLTTFDGATSQRGDPIAWIGYFRDNESTDDWRWISGEPVTYFRHDYGSWPQGGVHAYIHLPQHFTQPGTWNANPLHDSFGSAAPFGIIEVPEPTTTGLLAAGGCALLARRKQR